MTASPPPPPSLQSSAHRTPASRRPGRWRIADIIDGRALRVKLTAAALDNISNPSAARKTALNLLHGAMFRGRLIAQERLQQGADGLDTARLLAAVQDEVIHALYDFTVTHVHRASNPTAAERLAIVATGGYGRGVMAPSSDTDLLFLRAYKASPHTESVIEYMLYAIWDMGLKVGNAFRTPIECVKLAQDDVTIKTSMLDARFICGDEALASEMTALFDREAVKGKDAKFIADKLAERDARHARTGDARYVVEPNLKEGKGGLRDLQTLYWIVKHMYGGDRLEDVMRAGPFTEHEYAVFIRASRFLWTVRCHIHFVTGRAEDRLSFDLQPEIAARMGYRDREGQQGVERFMKRYFLVAKDVGGLTRILAAKLEAEHKKKPEGLRRFLPVRPPQPLPESGFMIETGRISITDDSVMASDALNTLRLFTIARREGKDIHPAALTALTRNLRTLTDAVRETPEAQSLILDSILGGTDPGLTLRRMNEAGVLGRAIPEFGTIVAQTQFNMYHHYTVDEHTIRAVETIADLEHGRGNIAPLAKGGDVVTARIAPEAGAVALLVSGKDRPGLFADLAGTLARLGANIVAAQVFTSRGGRIVDVFMLQDVRGLPFGEGDAQRLAALEKAIRAALEGNPAKGGFKSRTSRREAAFLVQPSVQIHDDISADCTVIDLAARDRPGLLHEVAEVLADLKLSIHSAHVGSYGERVFDAFYVQSGTSAGHLTQDRKEVVKERLMAVLSAEEPDGPQTPARKLKRSRAVDSF